MKIPKQLQKEDFKFIPLRGKIPIEKDWTQSNYSYNEPVIQDWISQGNNYGVVCGTGNEKDGYLFVIDVDNPSQEFLSKLLKQLPATFTVRTGGGGYHFYYLTSKPFPSKKVDVDGVHVDLQGKGKQVVGPNSIHPETKKQYEIIRDVEIYKLTTEDWQQILKLFFKKEISKQREISEEKLEKFLKQIIENLNCEDRGEYYLCHCPFHPPDNHPSFAIYKNTKLGVDFHDGAIYTMKDLAYKLGVSINHEKKSIVVVEKFSPVYYAEPILEKYMFIYDKYKRFWRYDPEEGIWKEDAEVWISSYLRKNLFGPETQKTHYVNEIVNYIRDISYKPIALEPPKHIVAFKNVVYDLDRAIFLKFSPDLYITNKIPVTLLEDAKECEKIDTFFSEIVGEDKKIILYELIAYCLYRDYPYQKIFYLYGSGANGKSTFLNLLTRFLGVENVATETPHDLINNRFSVANLFNKLANISSDISYEMLKNPNKIKMLTGSDYVNCERKYKDPFPFQNYAKLIFSTNLLPPTNDKTFAYYRRLYLIEFPREFKENAKTDLLNELTTERELSGLAWKSIDYLHKLREQGWRFTYDPDVEEVKEKYEKLSNPVYMFIQENCEDNPEGYIFVKAFYKDFKVWAKRKKLPLFGNNEISRYMEDLGYLKTKKRVGGEYRWAFVGLHWKRSASAEDKKEGFNKENLESKEYIKKLICSYIYVNEIVPLEELKQKVCRIAECDEKTFLEVLEKLNEEGFIISPKIVNGQKQFILTETMFSNEQLKEFETLYSIFSSKEVKV